MVTSQANSTRKGDSLFKIASQHAEFDLKKINKSNFSKFSGYDFFLHQEETTKTGWSLILGHVIVMFILTMKLSLTKFLFL